MNFQYPRIKLINKELKEPSYYFPDGFESNQVSSGLSIKFHDIFDRGLVFFIHADISITKKEENESMNIFHSDYLAIFRTSEVIDPSQEFRISKLELANMVGISIIMVKGSIMTILDRHILDGYQFPLVNPKKILESKLDHDEEYFTLNPS